MSKIYLVGCSKKKLDHPCEAQKMYNSVLFNMIQKQMANKKWYILSAKHNLLNPNEVIHPYDVTLNDMNNNDIKLWSEMCFRQIMNIHSGEEVVFLAGMTYRKYLVDMLIDENILVSIPMEGMGIGMQQKYIKENKL